MVSISGMTVSLKTDLRFPITRQQGHESRNIHLSDYIAKTYSVSLCVHQCQRLLHNLGFSLVRPQVFPDKGMGNEEERES